MKRTSAWVVVSVVHVAAVTELGVAVEMRVRARLPVGPRSP
jgi:hypothetical protein